MKTFLQVAFIVTILSGCTTASQGINNWSSMGDRGSASEAGGIVPSLVSDDYVAEQNRYYPKMLVGELSENDKIMYLIEELRQSPYSFERNGEVHKSVRAAQHLMMKYHRDKDRINSAEDFIEQIATKSNKSGRNYKVIFDSTHKYPSNVILRSELAKLNELLHARRIL